MNTEETSDASDVIRQRRSQVIGDVVDLVSVLEIFFSSLQMTRSNKLDFLNLAIIFQSSLTFAGNIRSLPKKEAPERSSSWVCSGLAL